MTKFTHRKMREVRKLLKLGKSGTDIARMLECNDSSLRRACHRHGISLREDRIIWTDVTITLRTQILDALRAEARQRGTTGPKLMAALLTMTVTDSLYAAILDQ